MEKIVIVGFGGHGKSVADIIESTNKYEIVGYTDIKKNDSNSYNYLGTDDILRDLYCTGVKNAVIGVGFMGHGNVRQKIYSELKKIGYCLPVLIDDSAIVSKTATVAEGTIVGKGAIINADVRVDENCIINTGAIVEHECHIKSGTHIAVGTVLCGQVKVGKDCFIGANSTVIQCLKIDNDVIVGAGSVVTQNVAEKTVVVGCPAKVIKDNE